MTKFGPRAEPIWASTHGVDTSNAPADVDSVFRSSRPPRLMRSHPVASCACQGASRGGALHIFSCIST